MPRKKNSKYKTKIKRYRFNYGNGYVCLKQKNAITVYYSLAMRSGG